MLRPTNRHHKAFTLLELIIVVVIIGIIAAIAIPRMSRGSQGAGESAFKGDLDVLRTAIDIYAAEHGGSFPSGTAAQVLAQLTTYSTVAGVTGAAKNPATGMIYGPYLKAMPPLPVGTKKSDSTMVVVTGAATVPPAAGTNGWWYNSTTGDIRANLAATETGDENKPYNQY